MSETHYPEQEVVQCMQCSRTIRRKGKANDIVGDVLYCSNCNIFFDVSETYKQRVTP